MWKFTKSSSTRPPGPDPEADREIAENSCCAAEFAGIIASRLLRDTTSVCRILPLGRMRQNEVAFPTRCGGDVGKTGSPFLSARFRLHESLTSRPAEFRPGADAAASARP